MVWLGPKPPHIANNPRRPNLNANAHAGMPRRFEELSPEQQNMVLEDILALPEIEKLADQPYAVWRDTLWAIADAGNLGATKAKELALAWSKTSSTKFDTGAPNSGDRGFNQTWGSFKSIDPAERDPLGEPAEPGKPKKSRYITIGTLIAKSVRGGVPRHRCVAPQPGGGRDRRPATRGCTQRHQRQHRPWFQP